MRKFTVFIEEGQKTVELDEPLHITKGSKMEIKQAIVYWFYKNIPTRASIKWGIEKIYFEPGYWNFDNIKSYLHFYDIFLTKNEYNSTCNVLSNQFDMKLDDQLGAMLGFESSTIIKRNETTSPNVADVNRGLRYLTINCDIINSKLNTDNSGNRSYTLSTLPITSEQNLASSVSFYKELDSKVVLNDGIYNSLTFYVHSNIEQFDKGCKVLAEIYIYK